MCAGVPSADAKSRQADDPDRAGAMSENAPSRGRWVGPTTSPGAIPADGMADMKRPSSVRVSDEPTVRETLQYCSSQRAPLNVPFVSRERSHLINTLDNCRMAPRPQNQRPLQSPQRDGPNLTIQVRCSSLNPGPRTAPSRPIPSECTKEYTTQTSCRTWRKPPPLLKVRITPG